MVNDKKQKDVSRRGFLSCFGKAAAGIGIASLLGAREAQAEDKKYSNLELNGNFMLSDELSIYGRNWYGQNENSHFMLDDLREFQGFVSDLGTEFIKGNKTFRDSLGYNPLRTTTNYVRFLENKYSKRCQELSNDPKQVEQLRNKPRKVFFDSTVTTEWVKEMRSIPQNLKVDSGAGYEKLKNYGKFLEGVLFDYKL